MVLHMPTKSRSTVELIGMGDGQFSFGVYIGNRPTLPEYHSLQHLSALEQGEITRIGQTCGNGWRKVFNVYAKLLYALDPRDFHFSLQAPTWQTYRDHYLLQANNGTALLFTPPILNGSSSNRNKRLHVIMGRTYAKKLVNDGLNVQLTWLNEAFAVDLEQRVIVCPYFDYRQLSNHKIQILSAILSKVLLGRMPTSEL